MISQTPGAMGGFGANHALRQCLVFLNVPVMQQPETFIGGTGKLFGKDGAPTSDETRAFLAKFMEAYAAWVRLLCLRSPPVHDGSAESVPERVAALP